MGEGPSQRDALLSMAAANLTIATQERELARSPEASQIRAARAMLDWSDRELATASGLSVTMVGKIQAGTTRPSPKTMSALREAFTAAGVVLISSREGTDEGLGVRLRKVEP